jgi:2-dehydropantoate 2-reductase
MRFVILGAGAMGSLFGARLAMSGHDVALIDVAREHIEAIAGGGLILDQDGVRKRITVEASATPTEIRPGDFLLVMTKANKLMEALISARRLIRDSGNIVVLCNGLGCGQAASQLVPVPRLLYGATAAGAMLDGPGQVRFTVDGETFIGPLAGPVPAGARVLAEALAGAGLPVQLSERIEEFIWTKLMVNVGYNAAGALTRVANGRVVGHPAGRQILEGAVREAMAVAAAKGIQLHYDDPVQFVVNLGLQVIGPNPSSMLQDVLRNRETEVEWLNGAVASEGARLGIPTPINQALAGLVKVLQDNYA